MGVGLGVPPAWNAVSARPEAINTPFSGSSQEEEEKEEEEEKSTKKGSSSSW